MSLAETREELVDSLQEDMSVLMNGFPVVRVGYELEQSAVFFQALGICNLLLYADADRFYENLVRSGQTRRYFLKKSLDEGNKDDYQLAISRWNSFLDVMAVGYFPLARDIAALSVSHWVPAGEYEDDFMYRLFLHNFIAPPNAQRDPRLRNALADWTNWLSGQPSARLECCAALMTRDSGAFEKSFDELVAQRQAEVAKQTKMAIAADICFEPCSQIFVEGLALLRIAEAIGLNPRADYPMCPAMALAPPTRPFPEDIFAEMERERAQGAGQP